MNAYLKAIYAGVVAALGSLFTAMAANQTVTAIEWVAIASAGVVGFGSVWGVTNIPPPPPIPPSAALMVTPVGQERAP